MTLIVDVAAGLWLWRQPHPDWNERLGWGPEVSSFCVESGGEVAVLDALRPPWERLDDRPPTFAVVLKPDHVRDVDAVVARYGCRAFGPDVFFRGDAPETELEWLYPGLELPFELVLVSHGEPVHDRAGFEAALGHEPHRGD